MPEPIAISAAAVALYKAVVSAMAPDKLAGEIVGARADWALGLMPYAAQCLGNNWKRLDPREGRGCGDLELFEILVCEKWNPAKKTSPLGSGLAGKDAGPTHAAEVLAANVLDAGGF